LSNRIYLYPRGVLGYITLAKKTIAAIATESDIIIPATHEERHEYVSTACLLGSFQCTYYGIGSRRQINVIRQENALFQASRVYFPVLDSYKF
jgi:hypothetical protein